ncbi:sulfotransferase [Fodinibius sp.]|uniref:sulfotransferase n=1 Tax=Fodinibius sp. TaxID=1872440 RepID=UPI002ACD3680|nr:sulfotransferase [Fodinibius sp.]MDZ7658653.1 sulfotransferase [Fodinibius sp.]
MVFILGIERSATTWVSNLLEAHPDTRVYVEPMSEITARFKKWPDRFEYIADFEEKARYFQHELEHIKKHKTWFLTKYLNNGLAWQFDLWFSNFLVRKELASEAARDFSEINFHRKAQPYVKKSKKPKIDVIKELRLNFNPGIIANIDNNAQVLVVIRNVFANIESILENMERGNLAELNRLLLEYYGAINVEVIYKYWRDSYNSLLKGLEGSKITYQIVYHTSLIQNPKREINKLGNFIGVDDTDSIINYLYQSNKKGSGIHNTNRSHAVLQKRNLNARKKIWPKIRDIIDIEELHPELKNIVELSN